MTQIYILDTSAILTDPYCMDNYSGAQIIIHLDVLNELDKIKTSPSAVGRQARVFIRRLDELSDSGNISEGITLENGSIVKVDTANYDTSAFGDSSYTDNKLLACANSFDKEEVIVVSNDINLRIRAKSIGLSAITCQKEHKSIDDLYSGYSKIRNQKLGELLKRDKIIDCSSAQLKDICPNECIIFTDKQDKIISIGRRVDDGIKIISNSKAWGLSSKNIEQAFVMDMLMDQEISLVSIAGIAGTGKTLLAMACGLEEVILNKHYDKLIIYRPIQPVGTDMGYLPGDLCDKLDPWMAAVKDSIDFLSSSKTSKNKKTNGNGNWKTNLAQYSDVIHMEALTYIRGRSISNAFILIDECQNISKDEIKTILTRAGHGTKVVLTGDIEQIDNYHLDALNNGLTYVIEKFKEHKLSGHMTLAQGERSPLATLSANIL